MIKGDPHWDKNEWRKAAKARRENLALNDAERNVINKSLLKILPKADALVSAYWPIGNELDTRPVLQFLAENNVPTALPRVNVDGDGLLFHRWRWGDKLYPSRFSLSEPAPDIGTICTPDVVLLPMLAFDDRGHRLGYGAGHYDRTLQFNNVLKVGFAFAEQRTNVPLPNQIHDVRLDAVLTQDGVLRFT